MANADQIQMVANSLSFKRLEIPYAKSELNVVDGQRQSQKLCWWGNTHLDRRHTVFGQLVMKTLLRCFDE